MRGNPVPPYKSTVIIESARNEIRKDAKRFREILAESEVYRTKLEDVPDNMQNDWYILAAYQAGIKEYAKAD
jgi:hypothetical protein